MRECLFSLYRVVEPIDDGPIVWPEDTVVFVDWAEAESTVTWYHESEELPGAIFCDGCWVCGCGPRGLVTISRYFDSLHVLHHSESMNRALRQAIAEHALSETASRVLPRLVG